MGKVRLKTISGIRRVIKKNPFNIRKLDYYGLGFLDYIGFNLGEGGVPNNHKAHKILGLVNRLNGRRGSTFGFDNDGYRIGISKEYYEVCLSQDGHLEELSNGYDYFLKNPSLKTLHNELKKYHKFIQQENG